MKRILLLMGVLISSLALSQSTMALGIGPKIFSTPSKAPPKGITNSEAIEGLKEALRVGAKFAAAKASMENGFYKNPLIFIPFPPEARAMKDTLETLGFGPQIAAFTKTLNRAAEEACTKAAPIFLRAIQDMTIQDGFKILQGGDTSATRYLFNKTAKPLAREFLPVVHGAMEKVGVTRLWNPLVKRYNQVPFFKPINPDLDRYVTERAVSGLFKLIAGEERKIRENPSARITEILRKVFGASGK